MFGTKSSLKKVWVGKNNEENNVCGVKDYNGDIDNSLETAVSQHVRVLNDEPTLGSKRLQERSKLGMEFGPSLLDKSLSKNDSCGPLPKYLPNFAKCYLDKGYRRSISVVAWPSHFAKSLSHFRKSRRNSLASDQSANSNIQLVSLKDATQDTTVSVATTSDETDSVLEINKIILESRDNVYALFMKAHHCFDLIPLSVKITAISSDLPVLKAFYAYVYNGVRASPLYVSDSESFNGIVTASDFIEIITKLYRDGSVADVLSDLEGFTLKDWRSMLSKKGIQPKPLVSIDPQDSMFKAVETMCSNRIHRLALVDSISGNVEFIVSYKRLLKFVFIYIKDFPFPSYMCKKPREIGIGEWNNVVTISASSKIIDLFRVFVASKKCFLPVVDGNEQLVNCCSKVDVIRYNIYHNLEMPIQYALNDPARNFYGVCTCTEDDCLMTVLEKMTTYDVHRLVAIDKNRKVIGIVSLSDVFRFLVLEPPSTSEPRVINREEFATKVTIEDSD